MNWADPFYKRGHFKFHRQLIHEEIVLKRVISFIVKLNILHYKVESILELDLKFIKLSDCWEVFLVLRTTKNEWETNPKLLIIIFKIRQYSNIMQSI